MTINSLFTEALQFIKHHQDGEVAETMRYRGLKYNMIYGVSSSILYTFVKKHGKNQELAKLLFKENFREAKLLALMIAEANKITKEELQDIVESIDNHELVEIASLHLFKELPNALHIAYEWIQSDKEFVKMSGYMIVRRIADKLKTVKLSELEKFLPKYEEDFTNGSYFVRNAVVNSFQEVAYRTPGIKNRIMEVTKSILKKNIGTEFELQAKDMIHVLNYC